MTRHRKTSRRQYFHAIRQRPTSTENHELVVDEIPRRALDLDLLSRRTSGPCIHELWPRADSPRYDIHRRQSEGRDPSGYALCRKVVLLPYSESIPATRMLRLLVRGIWRRFTGSSQRHRHRKQRRGFLRLTFGRGEGGRCSMREGRRCTSECSHCRRRGSDAMASQVSAAF